jgi:hypothetical protein
MVPPRNLFTAIRYLTLFATVLAALFVFGGSHLALAQSVTGKVFLDRDGDRVLDEGEPGIEGVMVSNQRDVVLTDENGTYTINAIPDHSVMVIKPAGYDVPRDSYGIPQFSALHSPNGSPEGLEYAGVPPSMLGSADSLHFPLLRGRTGTPFNAVLFGDPQPRDDEELTYIRDTFIGQSAREDARFMIVLGDVMYDDLSLLDRYKTLIAQTKKEVWHLVGNHDLNTNARSNRHARDTFKRHFGPNYYAFEYGNVFFVMLDNVDFLGVDEEGDTRYRGRIWGHQLTWLEEILRHIPASHQLVIGTHIPIYAWDGQAENVNTLNRDRLFDVLEGRKRVLMMSGHLHMTYHHFLGEQHGWNGSQPIHHLIAATVSGTWWGGPLNENLIPVATQRDGVPNGYHRFTFADSTYRERFIGLGRPSQQQLRLETFFDTPHEDELPSELVVNVFNGTRKSKVWYRLAGREWQEMSQTVGSSPYYEQLLARFPEDWSPNLRAIPTNHLWVGDFPADLPAGTHRIDIKTEDAYGQMWEISRVIEIGPRQ